MALVRTIAKQGDPKTGRVLDEIIRDIEYLTAPHAYRSPLLAAAESYDHTKASAKCCHDICGIAANHLLGTFPSRFDGGDSRGKHLSLQSRTKG